MVQRAEKLAADFVTVEKEMSRGSFDQDTSVRFSKLLAIVDQYTQYRQNCRDVEELAEFVKDETDPELLAEAQADLAAAETRLADVSRALQKRLLPEQLHTDKPAILELRPGVGGLEALIFTEDLVAMYTAYAAQKRWPSSILLASRTSAGMLNEAIISVDGPGAYDILRHESGVHRVQRVPATEAKGRIHTSTAAVVVLPKVSGGTEQSLKEDERQFAPGEVRIDTMRSGGKGGQHVNTTDSAVRLVHIPTGIMVMQQDERLQPKNKAKAFLILRARLAQREREQQFAEQRKLRVDQVATTDRSDKIRTYNYPQNRVTDHRCGHLIHDLPAFMLGTLLDEMVQKVEEVEFEERLQALINC